MLTYFGYLCLLALSCLLFIANLRYRKYSIIEQFEKKTPNAIYAYFVIDIKKGFFIENEQNIAFSKAKMNEYEEYVENYGRWWINTLVKHWRPDWVDSGQELSQKAKDSINLWIKNQRLGQDGRDAMNVLVDDTDATAIVKPQQIQSSYFYKLRLRHLEAEAGGGSEE